MILGNHILFLSLRIFIVRKYIKKKKSYQKKSGYWPKCDFKPTLVTHFIYYDYLQKTSALCKSQIHTSKNKEQTHDRHICNINFPGHISTEGRVQIAIKNYRCFFSALTALLALPFCSLLYPAGTESWCSPGDRQKLLLNMKGPVSILPSLLAPAVAISVASDQVALHLIVGVLYLSKSMSFLLPLWFPGQSSTPTEEQHPLPSSPATPRTNGSLRSKTFGICTQLL